MSATWNGDLAHAHWKDAFLLAERVEWNGWWELGPWAEAEP